jgi:hypothetical protein
MSDPALPDASGSRWRGRVQTARQTAAQVPVRLEDARTQHSSVDVALSLSEHDRVVGGGGLLAGALAFRLFLWLLPAALTLVGGLGFFDSADATHERPRRVSAS